MAYSDIYSRLVKDDNDVAGQIAYSIYKRTKTEFVAKKQAELGVMVIPEDIFEEFYANQTDYVLDLYRNQARRMMREFLNASYEDEIAEEQQRLSQEYCTKYEKLAESVKPSFWYGVLQSITASFLFILSGYIILKMSGSWDILLNNLFR